MESKIQAANNYVLLVQDEPETEVGGLLLPDSAVKKTNFGKVVSVGELVMDKKIKPNKICAFHNGIGFNIQDDGMTYLVLRGEEILYIK